MAAETKPPSRKQGIMMTRVIHINTGVGHAEHAPMRTKGMHVIASPPLNWLKPSITFWMAGFVEAGMTQEAAVTILINLFINSCPDLMADAVLIRLRDGLK